MENWCIVFVGNQFFSDKFNLEKVSEPFISPLYTRCFVAKTHFFHKLPLLKAQMVYKSLNGLTPNYLSSKFIQRSDVITSYNLRDSENKLAIPLPRTNYYKNIFGYSGEVPWNSLPSAARQATSLTNFRRWLINFSTRHSCKTGFNLVYFL